MSPALVTLTSRSNSDLESSNISFKENISDGADLNPKGSDYCNRKNEGKIIWFSASIPEKCQF